MLQVPNLAATACHLFRACGTIGAGSRAGKQTTLVARHRTEEGVSIVRLIYGGNAPKHLHLEIMRLEYFKGLKARPPKATSTLGNIERVIAKHHGQVATVAVTGFFRMPVESVHSNLIFAGPNAVSTKIGEVTVEVIGATLNFEGPTSVEGIDWAVGGDDIFLSFVARHDEVAIDDAYVCGLFEQTERALRRYVIGEAADAPQ